MAILSAIFVCGLFLDGWAHNHHRVDKSFFTPWHAVFYGAFALLALFTLIALWNNHRAGYAWTRSLPRGYGWTFIGGVIFLVAGIGDLIWHTIFGIETNTAALLSPTHLGLATGMLLIIGGPFRAALKRGQPSASLPAIVSLTCVLSVLTFITQYSNALFQYGVAPGPPRVWFELMESRGVVSQLWSTTLIMGVILVALRSWGPRLPIGSITFVLVANAALMATQSDEYYFLPAVAIAGIAGDALVMILNPSPERIWAFRGFAAVLPVIYWLGHYLTYFASGQSLYYPVPTWTGCILISGFVGLLLSMLVLMPQERAPAAPNVPTSHV